MLARTIADNGPLAVRKIKETVLRASGVTLDEGYGIEDQSWRIVLASDDAKEFRRVVDIPRNGAPQQTLAFAPTTAKHSVSEATPARDRRLRRAEAF